MSGLPHAPRFRSLPQRKARPNGARPGFRSRDYGAKAPGMVGARPLVRPRRSSAFLLTGVIFALSLLGFTYLVEISRVASLGYTLSTLRARQTQLAHEQALLTYQVSTERRLAEVERLARDQYGMRPFDRVVADTAAGAAQPVPSAGTRATPARQFVTVQRPAAAPPPATPTPLPSPSFGERLWRQLAGIGVAGDATP